jgi:hypothetical protein
LGVAGMPDEETDAMVREGDHALREREFFF